MALKLIKNLNPINLGIIIIQAEMILMPIVNDHHFYICCYYIVLRSHDFTKLYWTKLL